jgi:hypothetical protein
MTSLDKNKSYRDNDMNSLIKMVLLFVVIGITFYFGYDTGQRTVTRTLFNNKSDRYLEKLKLDLPEEISQVPRDTAINMLASRNGDIIELFFPPKSRTLLNANILDSIQDANNPVDRHFEAEYHLQLQGDTNILLYRLHYFNRDSNFRYIYIGDIKNPNWDKFYESKDNSLEKMLLKDNQ